MQLGQVIRKYRKQKKLTQEEMAFRLGVTAPAVNKWERGVSLPDISLLAPIARLLEITTDDLLSFREKLTDEEINDIINQANHLLEEKSYEEVFDWAGKMLQQYPGCEKLIWQLAVILDAGRIIGDVPDQDKYDDMICAWYEQALESKDETIRQGAADSLFGLYIRKNEFEKAEKYLSFFSLQNPERKRKQAQIYSEMNRISEAYQAYEELLFADYQMVSATIQGLFVLAIKEKNYEKAHFLADKLLELTKCFEMGQYREAASQLEIATIEKNRESLPDIMEQMLEHVDDINSFTRSPLYEHMKFKDLDETFLKELKNNLLKCFRDEETYGFLKNEERWERIRRRK
ncbi:MAG: helix-turn-helix domain-containing protein [Eubacterium sp.]|nr:helix-turn-helix domain-containing protein [Eubacterium sp.]